MTAVRGAIGSLKSGNKHAGGNGRWPNNPGSCGACTVILIAPAVEVEAPVAVRADKKSAERQPDEYFTNEFGRSVKVGADDGEALQRAAEYQPPTREAQLEEVRQAVQLAGGGGGSGSGSGGSGSGSGSGSGGSSSGSGSAPTPKRKASHVFVEESESSEAGSEDDE